LAAFFWIVAGFVHWAVRDNRQPNICILDDLPVPIFLSDISWSSGFGASKVEAMEARNEARDESSIKKRQMAQSLIP
jgi:hypothetical protein